MSDEFWVLKTNAEFSARDKALDSFPLAHSLLSFEATEGDEMECFFAGMGDKFIPANPLSIRA